MMINHRMTMSFLMPNPLVSVLFPLVLPVVHHRYGKSPAFSSSRRRGAPRSIFFNDCWALGLGCRLLALTATGSAVAEILSSGVCSIIQWEFQDPKMEVLYHIRPYFLGIFPYIALKNRPIIIWNRYLQFFRFLKCPLNNSMAHRGPISRTWHVRESTPKPCGCVTKYKFTVASEAKVPKVYKIAVHWKDHRAKGRLFAKPWSFQSNIAEQPIGRDLKKVPWYTWIISH